MPTVEIYTTPRCTYCRRAKDLFDQKDVEYEEINLADQPERKEEMLRRSDGQRTVPQIFINDQHVGGSDELVALDRAGELDELLNSEEEPA